MKKSEIYKMAQEAVITVPFFKTAEQLEILRVLMKDEDSALFWEKEEEKKATEKEQEKVAQAV